MKRLLLMEGNIRESRDLAKTLGVRTASAIYSKAILSHYPDIEIDILNAADEGEIIPNGRVFSDYDGLVISGSGLHSYDDSFAVKNQIENLKIAGATGMPIFGSCWGLQIATIAAGGTVGLSPNGREIGFARKIVPTEIGKKHPMLAQKGSAFDAPCIHYDEVTKLPDDAILLASNRHSEVQAAIITVGNSKVWAVQYHPEFDLLQLQQLLTLYEDDMINQKFFSDLETLRSYRDKLKALAENPDDNSLAWQLGIDSDITVDEIRRAEILSWLHNEVL